MTVIEVGAAREAQAERIRHLLRSAGVDLSIEAGAYVVDAARAPEPIEIEQLKALASRHPGRLAIVVDQMDRVGCEYVVYAECRQRLTTLGLKADFITPAIAETGEGIVSGSDRIEWFGGPTLRDWLKGFATA